MSLINDALRRAGESSRRRRRRVPSAFAPLKPVDRLDRGGAGLKWVGFFLVLSFGAALWFLWRAGQPTPELESAQLPEPRPGAIPLELPRPIEPEPEPKPAESPPALTKPSQIRVSTNLVVRTATGPATVEGSVPKAAAEPQAKEAVVASGPFPEIRLQSIIFRQNDPMAMINGQTVVPGDRVDGVLVLEVRRDRVVLVWEEEQREVRLREL